MHSPTEGWNTLQIDQAPNLVSQPGLRSYSPRLGRWMSRDPGVRHVPVQCAFVQAGAAGLGAP